MSITNFIVFATDFGPGSEWVGICHAVMAGIAPAAHVIDLMHALPQFDVPAASVTLSEAIRYAPVAACPLIVDPSVGTQRRAVAIACQRGDVLVGPDNGLLPAVADALGGAIGARELTQTRFHLQRGSATFQARDIFCPVAAHLAAGARFEDLGPPIDVPTLVPSWTPGLHIEPGRVVCDVTNVDNFGNVRLAAKPPALAQASIDETRAIWSLGPSGELAAHRANTYADVEPGHLGLIVDSFGWLCLVINRGSAAEKLGAQRGSEIELREHS